MINGDPEGKHRNFRLPTFIFIDNILAAKLKFADSPVV